MVWNSFPLLGCEKKEGYKLAFIHISFGKSSVPNPSQQLCGVTSTGTAAVGPGEHGKSMLQITVAKSCCWGARGAVATEVGMSWALSQASLTWSQPFSNPFLCFRALYPPTKPLRQRFPLLKTIFKLLALLWFIINYYWFIYELFWSRIPCAAPSLKLIVLGWEMPVQRRSRERQLLGELK